MVTPLCKFDYKTVHYETFSTAGIVNFGKIFLDLLATYLSPYLTFSGKGPQIATIFFAPE
jgi:hypothetical protein